MIARALDALRLVFRYHKKKIGFFLLSISLCLVMTFPYDDLSDFVTLQVTRLTQASVYLQFDGLSFALLPQAGILMENVVIESVYSPTLSVKSLGFAPKILGLITGRPGGVLKAYGLFRGDVNIAFASQKSQDGESFDLDLDFESLNLNDLSKFLKESHQFPISLKGTSNLKSTLTVDPRFTNQPKGDIELVIRSFEIPATQIPLQMSMTFPLPSIKLNEVRLIGNLKDRRFLIKEGQIGKPGNDLYGTVTGDFIIDMLPNGQAKMGGYDLRIDLNVSDTLNNQLSGILTFVDNYQSIGQRYKAVSLDGVRYRFALQASGLQAYPQVKPL